MERIQPSSGALADAYIAGCRVGELRLQCCSRCGLHQFYPRIMCAHCFSEELEWVAATGRGEIISFTVVRRPISRAYDAPYVVALIKLQEGPTLMSHIVDCAPETIAVGLPVQVAFASWSESVALPVFTLDRQRGSSS